VGTVRFRLLDNDPTVDDPIYGPSAANIVEDPTGSGDYLFTAGVAPSALGTYSRAWDRGAGTDLSFDDDLVVNASGSPAPPSGDAYAAFADVTARAGRIAAAFTVAETVVGRTEIDAFLVTCASEIDAEISARGFDPSALSQAAIAALVDLNAYGALARALTALVPGSRGANAQTLNDQAWKVWNEGIASIKDGTHPVIAMLVSGQGGAAAHGAGSFWTEEPNYGSLAGLAAEETQLQDTDLQVGFRRNEVL
jgi:hypothetical protein